MNICPDCKEMQWSIMDKQYLAMFGHCWSCDKQRWLKHELSTEDFEEREKLALKNSH